MKIAFHGAARTVTGSKHLITLTNGKKLLLDCGMFQGMGPETIELNSEFGFNPKEITYVILSHAHIDHCGLIPKLIKDGYNGKVYATPATKDLATVLMEDSAGIQENDVKFENKKRALLGLPYLKPLYTTEDAIVAANHFEIVDYDKWFKIDDNFEFCYTDVGHIIASAVGEVNVVEKMKQENAVIGGEGNGGIIVPDLHYGRDALIGIALFLTHLAKIKLSAAALKASLPAYYMSKKKMELDASISLDKIYAGLEIQFSTYAINKIDGMKIDFENKWVHLRPSNTEPIVRIYTEAPTQLEADDLADNIISIIHSI